MSQTELLSKWANQKMYTSVAAYSGRFGVRVLVGGTDTYEYGRPSHGKSTDQHVREVVRDALERYTEGIHDTSSWDIALSQYGVIPGEWFFTVWMPK